MLNYYNKVIKLKTWVYFSLFIIIRTINKLYFKVNGDSQASI